MASVTENPPTVTVDPIPQNETTLTTMLGTETFTARRALNFASPLTSEHEATQAILEQAKQNEQRLENMIVENKHLHQDLALEVAKSKQVAYQGPERPVRAAGQRSRARQQDTDSNSDSLSSKPKKKERSEISSSS